MKHIYLYLILPLVSTTILINGVKLTDEGNSNRAVTSISIPNKIITAELQNNPHGTDLGIGPVKKVELGAIDNKMVDQGKALFNTKCMMCHDMSQKKVGPPLGDITKQRTPEFIMNLLLNTVQMEKENPAMKELFNEYNNIPMPNPALNQQQARSILEYLRSVAN